MGCTNSFIYSSAPFKNVLYTERIDKRIGQVYMVQNLTTAEGFLAKEITSAEKAVFESRTVQFRRILKSCAKLVVLPISISDNINILASESSGPRTKSKDRFWLKMDNFSKDLEDEVNLKVLKGKPFAEFELWAMIYNLVFVFAALESGSIQIDDLKPQNILISKSTFKYFPENFYQTGDEEQRRIENKQQQFDRVRLDLLHLLTAIQVEKDFNGFTAYDPNRHNSAHFEEVLGTLRNRLSKDLFDFFSKRLLKNVDKFGSFHELRGLLMELYHGMDCEYLDSEILQEYAEEVSGDSEGKLGVGKY